MAKGTNLQICGYDMFLCYSCEAMLQLDAMAKESGNESTIDLLSKPISERDTTIKAACILAEQGELIRRAAGYDKKDMPDADFIISSINICEYKRLRESAAAAILLGLEREVKSSEDDEGISITLMEIEKKTVNKAH